MSARRALVISPRPPEFDRESGLLRLSDLIDMLLARGWDVTFGCLRAPTDRERYVRQLEQRGVQTHVPIPSIDAVRGAGDFDLAILSFWHVAERFLGELRRASPSTRVIVDSVDLHFLREIREGLGLEAGPAQGRIEPEAADRMIREVNTYAAADAVLTVSEKEAALVNDLVGRSDLAMHIPDTEELPRSRVPLRQRRGILFLGNFLHAPNCDAASFLCTEIIPRLDRSLLAEHEVSIVGTAAEDHVSELAAGLPEVRVVGWVPSVLPYLQNARISVVPLRYGAGTKRKIIQALMAGTPTVTTTVGAEGLGVRDGRQVLIADDPDAFAAGIERLLTRSLTWRRLARQGRAHVAQLHGRATVEARFDRVLDEALARSPRAAVEGPVAADADMVRPPAYAQLVTEVRKLVESGVPAGAQVLVATRGDDGLLGFEGRTGWHFPREVDGRYAGYHPADSEAAIEHLESLRRLGASHFVLPRTAFWWLSHYQGLHQHLAATYRVAHSGEQAIVYELSGGEPVPTPAVAPAAEPVQDEDAVAPERVSALQPSPLAAASRYRNGGEARRALVLGVYLAGKPNTAEHVAATIGRSSDVEVEQRWVALGGEPPGGELASVTAMTVTDPTPKYLLLNRLLAEEDLASYDFILTTDDDIVVPDGFMDLFLGVQGGLGWDLAQPARTLNSYVDHPIVLQQVGVLARRTLFVEIGPLVSFGRDIYDLVFPFDDTNPMGWGFENVWSHLLREAGKSEGIVDAVPVDHSIRKPVAHYEWAGADADRERYLAGNPHLPIEDCFKVLDVVGVGE
jgi:Glycosyl transferases group 1